MKTETKPRSVLLVDGNCIVCDFEISHYKRMAPEKFDVVDISDPAFDAAKYGLTPEAVNKHMHALTPEGQVVKGVEAFAHIWDTIPKYHWAGRLVRKPVVNQLAKVGYSVFATVRPLLPKRHR